MRDRVIDMCQQETMNGSGVAWRQYIGVVAGRQEYEGWLGETESGLPASTDRHPN